MHSSVCFTVENTSGVFVESFVENHHVNFSMFSNFGLQLPVNENKQLNPLVPDTLVEMVPFSLWDIFPLSLCVTSPHGEGQAERHSIAESHKTGHRQPHSESYSGTESINTHLKGKHVSTFVLTSYRLVVLRLKLKPQMTFHLWLVVLAR